MPDEPQDELNLADPDETPEASDVAHAAVAPAEPSPPALPAELVGKATAAGISADDLKDFDEKTLAKTLALLEKSKPAEQPKATEAPKADPPKEPDWDVPWSELVTPDEDVEDHGKPTEKVVHKSIQRVINKVHAHYKEELAKRDGILKQLWEDAQKRNAKEGMDLIDQTFAEVEDLYPELGKGKRSQLKEDSREHKLTIAVCGQMELLAQNYQKAGKKIPSNAALRDEVLETLYGKRVKGEPAPERPRDPATGQYVKPTAMAVPTHRNGSAPKGLTREEQVTNELAEKLKARGLTADSANESLSELQEGLLG